MSINKVLDTAQSRPELVMFGRKKPEPGDYHLNIKSVAEFPLHCNGELSTFVDVYRKLRDAKIIEMPNEWAFTVLTFVTNAGEVKVSGETSETYVPHLASVLGLLRDLIGLHKDGIDPHRAKWFYYDHDWSRDADEVYVFFLVDDGKIAREKFSFMVDDPRVLVKSEEGDDPIWHSWPYQHAAVERYWYRKFYTETLTGQLMVLRPDEPILYNYQRPAGRDVMRDVEFVTLIKIYRLLWIAVPLLAAIAFPILKIPMAIIASAFAVDLMWTHRQTRKIGR